MDYSLEEMAGLVGAAEMQLSVLSEAVGIGPDVGDRFSALQFARLERAWMERGNRGREMTAYDSYQEYCNSAHFRRLREKYVKAVGRCQLCGEPDQARLELHHNNYKCLWNETFRDVVVLCCNCHRSFHRWGKVLDY